MKYNNDCSTIFMGSVITSEKSIYGKLDIEYFWRFCNLYIGIKVAGNIYEMQVFIEYTEI